jgi:hypothetical protein
MKQQSGFCLIFKLRKEWCADMYRIKRLIVSILTVFMLCGLVVAADSPEGQRNAPTGVLTGQFMKYGKTPLANGRLYIYDKAMGPPSADRYVRVPDQIIDLDKDGKFLLQLPAGIYFLSAVKEPAGVVMGPPPEGEPIYFKMDAKKEIQPFTVRAGKKTNTGVVTTSLPYKRSISGNDGSGVTMIEGSVIDENDAPVEGAVILAHLRPGIQDKASYVSERTAKDGKFILRVTDGGTYYLRVRSEYRGGAPSAGDFVNYNDPKEQVAVSLKKGEKLAGVSIKARRQPEKGPLGQAK